jgi:hypothetical protein
LFEKLRKVDTIIEIGVLPFVNSTLHSDQNEELFLSVEEYIQDSTPYVLHT